MTSSRSADEAGCGALAAAILVTLALMRGCYHLGRLADAAEAQGAPAAVEAPGPTVGPEAPAEQTVDLTPTSPR